MNTVGTGAPAQGEIMQAVAESLKLISEIKTEFDCILTKLSPVLPSPEPSPEIAERDQQKAETPLARELLTMSSRLRKHHADLLDLKEKLNI